MPHDPVARLPEPPYYAVIFSSVRHEGDEGYAAMASRMVALAAQQPGYLGVESVRGDDRFGITVSYWQDEASIQAWREQAEHVIARELGKQKWYEVMATRVCKVERAYGFARQADGVLAPLR
ncbi:antibiotic biosynthesis monooxygenase family protein [Leeia aquatica]|uniref:Antibiotic biosynthesis monooxygenase n=1 Tax=Leeia aquatica TaxID=2725557 RepID=A0A847S6Q6_9NEIS|nr:antibiotic biosynthesis monooxygenase [Leeia aquatica]NLR75443.1 antibiotic biosynthesis monooxygenase [Leeia aquatica]